MTWSPPLRPKRGTFTERSRRLEPRIGVWVIEGSFAVESVTFSVTTAAAKQRGMQQCIAEGRLRMENGERDFIVEPRAGLDPTKKVWEK